MTEWVVIPNWERFQHYRDRDPPWIKLHRGLASDPDWLQLSGHARAVLVGLWLTYASSHRQVILNTSSLSRQLGLRVMTRDIERLVDAGFVVVSASRPLAPRYHDASPEGEGEGDTKAVTSTRDANGNGPHGLGFDTPEILKGVDDEW